jgi:hypothetical protein
MYPVIGLDPADLREPFDKINTRDRDEWAAAFISVADRYVAEGHSLEKSDPAKADTDFVRAWRLFGSGAATLDRNSTSEQLLTVLPPSQFRAPMMARLHPARTARKTAMATDWNRTMPLATTRQGRRLTPSPRFRIPRLHLLLRPRGRESLGRVTCWFTASLP